MAVWRSSMMDTGARSVMTGLIIMTLSSSAIVWDTSKRGGLGWSTLSFLGKKFCKMCGLEEKNI